MTKKPTTKKKSETKQPQGNLKMRYPFFGLAALVTIAVLMLSVLSGISRVPAGYVGVKVYLFGGNKGVDAIEVGPGYHYLGWNQELHLFPTFTQNYCWTKGNDPQCGSATNEEISFQTLEGLTVHADVGITYNLLPEKGVASSLFQKFRKGIPEITDSYLRNIVRDAIVSIGSSKTVEEVYGRGKVEIMNSVEQKVKDQVTQLKLNIENIYWIGEIRLPKSVTESLNAKIAATQMAQQRQNEVAQAKAEADKAVEAARGRGESVLVEAQKQAEANALLARSLTPELIQNKALEKWDGVACRTACGTSTVPFIQIDPSVKK